MNSFLSLVIGPSVCEQQGCCDHMPAAKGLCLTALMTVCSVKTCFLGWSQRWQLISQVV